MISLDQATNRLLSTGLVEEHLLSLVRVEETTMEGAWIATIRVGQMRTKEQLVQGSGISPKLAVRGALHSLNFFPYPAEEAPPNKCLQSRSGLHQFEVGSPIDTLEVCVHCGKERGCAPLVEQWREPFVTLTKDGKVDCEASGGPPSCHEKIPIVLGGILHDLNELLKPPFPIHGISHHPDVDTTYEDLDE